MLFPEITENNTCSCKYIRGYNFEDKMRSYSYILNKRHAKKKVILRAT